MDLQKHYVNTHCQNKIGIAFSHLLGFELLPRIKNIHTQKLYRPEVGMARDGKGSPKFAVSLNSSHSLGVDLPTVRPDGQVCRGKLSELDTRLEDRTPYLIDWLLPST
jgi:hypothetical protein